MSQTIQAQPEYIRFSDAARHLNYTYMGFKNLARCNPQFPQVVRTVRGYEVERVAFEAFAATHVKRARRLEGSTTDRLARIEMLLSEMRAELKRAA